MGDEFLWGKPVENCMFIAVIKKTMSPKNNHYTNNILEQIDKQYNK